MIALDVESDCVGQLLGNLGQPANVTARVLDVVDLEFVKLREQAVDSVVSLNVLEHVQDDLLALRNMAAVLPAGGKAVLICDGVRGPVQTDR